MITLENQTIKTYKGITIPIPSEMVSDGSPVLYMRSIVRNLVMRYTDKKVEVSYITFNKGADDNELATLFFEAETDDAVVFGIYEEICDMMDKAFINSKPSTFVFTPSFSPAHRDAFRDLLFDSRWDKQELRVSHLDSLGLPTEMRMNSLKRFISDMEDDDDDTK